MTPLTQERARGAARLAVALAVVGAGLRGPAATAPLQDPPVRPRAPAAGQEPEPEVGLPLPRDVSVRVDGDLRVRPGSWLRPPLGEDGRAGVLRIEGVEGVTVDLSGVELRGAPEGTPLDRLTGWGIVVRRSRDVRIVGGTIGGYRGCIVVEESENVTIEDVRFDGWHGMRLQSTVGAESPSDWLYPHENDDGQWLANYGGAISLTDCRASIVRNCRGRHGQNGVLLTRCEDLQVYDNDFSFLSGWGVAMYRSSQNVVSRNILDYCVRGYSHGVYWRGQDSAAILMFERCSDNLIAYNSGTHSGDGLFLYAGQDVVEGRAFERGETVVGGSDRNVIYGNDFSYAVANAVELTFSADNIVFENRLDGAHQHGVWGGYSRRMLVVGNTIEGTRGGGITIEHGQECVIAHNVLLGNEIGLELYWDEDPSLVDGPFGEHFDTSSRGHWVYRNSFENNDADLQIRQTADLRFGENVFAVSERSPTFDLLTTVAGEPLDLQGVQELVAGVGGWMPTGLLERSSIGAFPEEPPRMLLQLLDAEPPAAPGTQVAFDPTRRGTDGLESIVMGEWGPWDFRSGEQRPEERLPGGLLADSDWLTAWFSWKDGPDPRGQGEALAKWRALADEPAIEHVVRGWLGPHAGFEDVAAAIGETRFGLIATTKVSLPGGRYELSVVSDDGCASRSTARPSSRTGPGTPRRATRSSSS